MFTATTLLILAYKEYFYLISGEFVFLTWQFIDRLDTLPTHWSFDNTLTNLKFPGTTLGHNLCTHHPSVLYQKGNVWLGGQTTLLSKLIDLWAR